MAIFGLCFDNAVTYCRETQSSYSLNTVHRSNLSSDSEKLLATYSYYFYKNILTNTVIKMIHLKKKKLNFGVMSGLVLGYLGVIF